MFTIRAVHGDFKGLYFTGFDKGGTWGQLDAAIQMPTPEAVSIIVALIDGPCVVAVPECVESTTEDDCSIFANLIAKDLFASPSPDTIDLINKRVIRRSQTKSIHEQPSNIEINDTGFMSVFEWLHRSIDYL
jgi:hypothetical protein